MIKVLIVDDHTSVREAFKAMFEEKENAGSLYRRLNARLQSAIIVCMFHLPILSKPGW